MIEYSSNEWVVEPSNVTLINCVTSINIANYARNRCLKPDCEGGNTPEGKYYEPDEEKPVLINKTGMEGLITVTPGFNCSIREKDNVFTVEAIQGGGACIRESYCGGGSIPINSEEEELVESGESLDGCVMCNETLKAINGVTGKTISIQGGSGVSVYPEDENTLVIKLETQQFKNGCKE